MNKLLIYIALVCLVKLSYQQEEGTCTIDWVERETPEFEYTNEDSEEVQAEESSSSVPVDRGSRDIFFTSENSKGEVSARFCGLDDDYNCNFPQYLESILFTKTWAGYLVALICILFGISYLCCRRCIWGGKKPNHGMFCPGEKFDFDKGEGYTTKEVWIVKPLIWFCFVFMVVFSLIGISGNISFSISVNQFGENIIVAGEDLLFELQNLQAKIQDLEKSAPFPVDISSLLTEGLDAGEDLLDQITTVANTTNTYDGHRQTIVWFCYILSLIFFSTLFFGACLNWTGGAKITVFFGMFVLPLCFVSFSTSYPLATVLEDLCYSIDEIFDSGRIPEELVNMIKCRGNTFDSYLNATEILLEEAKNEACGVYDIICNTTVPCYCDGKNNTELSECNIASCYQNVTCSEKNIYQLVEGILFKDFDLGCPEFEYDTQEYSYDVEIQCGDTDSCDQGVPCDLQDVNLESCATSCRQYDMRSYADQISDGLVLLRGLESLLNNEIKQLLSCTRIKNLWDSQTNLLCNDLQGSLVLLYVASLLLGIAWIPGVILGILSRKRLNKKYRRKKEFDIEPSKSIKTLKAGMQTYGRKRGNDVSGAEMKNKKSRKNNSYGDSDSDSSDAYWENQ